VSDKKTVLVLSDHPLSASGVGSQTKYVIEALLQTGRYRFICLGGAVKHHDYRPMKIQGWEEDWIIHPVDGYGNPDIVRSIMRSDKPDIMWFMTDPRFWGWLWDIEDEIRPNMPMIYYHVWDNTPYPTFNKVAYEANDIIATISKVTDDIVRTVAPDVKAVHIPHAVNTDVFRKIEEKELIDSFKKDNFATTDEDENRMIFFWNNRNARRKQSGSIIFWFKKFLDIVGHDKASLVMHTEIFDPHGQNLQAIIEHLGLTNGEVKFSQKKVPPEVLSMMYNMADCTLNVSDAEGFGLGTLESLACETPIIVNMTGGLQEQVTDGKEWFGVGIEPSSKAVIGSQEIPWIYEDRINEDDFVNALLKIYNMTAEERAELGRKGREHVLKNYGFETFSKQWVDTMDFAVENFGSWSNRKNYNSWHLIEVK